MWMLLKRAKSIQIILYDLDDVIPGLGGKGGGMVGSGMPVSTFVYYVVFGSIIA